MSNILTRDEINQLIDAVETWSRTNEVPGSKLFSMMMGNMGDPEKSKEMIDSFHEEMSRKANSKREQGILLQAKLIRMRDQADLDEAKEFLKNGDK